MDELEFLYVFITLKAGVSKTENPAINVDMDHIYNDPKWKLYIVFKSIYFDDKLSFRVIFFNHRIFNALSMSLKKILKKKHKLHNFYEKFSSEGSKLNFFKTIKTVTQILETRNYWLRALSDVKKIISNQCDLHFYECYSRIRRLIEFT